MSFISLFLKVKGPSTDQFVVQEDSLTYNERSYQFEKVFEPGSDLSTFANDLDATSSCSIFMGPTGSGKTTTMKQVLEFKLKQLRQLRIPVFMSAVEITHNRYAVDLLESDPFHARKEYVHTREFNTRKEKVDQDMENFAIIHKVFKARTTQKTKFNSESSRSCLIVSFYHNGKRSVFMDLVGNEKFDKDDPGANVFGNMSMSSITQILTGKKPQRSNSMISNLIFRKPGIDTSRKVKLMLVLDPEGDSGLIKLSLRNIAELAKHFKLGSVKSESPNNTLDLSLIPELLPADKNAPGYSRPTIALTLSSPSVSRESSPARKRGRSLSPVKWKKQKLNLDSLSSSPVKVYEEMSPANSPPKIMSLNSSPIRRKLDPTSKFRVSYKGKLEQEIEQLKKLKSKLDLENLECHKENKQLKASLQNAGDSLSNLETEKLQVDQDLILTQQSMKSLQEEVENANKLLLQERKAREAEKETMLNDFKSKALEQQGVIENLDNEIKNLLVRHEEYQLSVASRYEATETSYKRSIEELHNQYHNEHENLKSLYSNAEKQIHEHCDVAKLLRQEIESLKESHAQQLELQTNQRASVVQELENSVLSLKRIHSQALEQQAADSSLVLQKKEAEFETLKQETQLELNSLKQDIRIHKTTAVNKQEVINKLENEVAEKQLQLLEKIEEVVGLRNDAVKLCDEKNSLLEQWIELKQDFELFRDEHSKFHKVVEAAKNSVDSVAKENTELQIKLENLVKERDSIREEFECSKHAESEKDLLITSLEERVVEMEGIISEIKISDDNNKSTISELQEENGALMIKFQKLDSEKTAIQLELKEQKEINVSLREDVSSLLFEADDSIVKNEEIIFELKKNLLEKDSVIAKITGQFKNEISNITRAFDKEREGLHKEIELAKRSPSNGGGYSAFTSPLLANHQNQQVDFLDQFTNFNDSLMLNHIQIYEDEVQPNMEIENSTSPQQISAMRGPQISSNTNTVTAVTDTHLGPENKPEKEAPTRVLGANNTNLLPPAVFEKKLQVGSLKENKIKNLIY